MELHKMMQLFRFQVTINAFKKHLIGDIHNPEEAQEDAVFGKLQIDEKKINGKTILSETTWKNWCKNKYDSMKITKAESLDLLAKEKITIKTEGDSQTHKLPDYFFKELCFGGLASEMLKTSKAKITKANATKAKITKIRNMLVTRANDYTPISLLHLHLDAIEAITLTDDFYDVPWNEVMKITAQRILYRLFYYWGPRHGKIYSSFSSSLKLKWDEADENERKKIREFYSRFQPDLFEEKMQPGAEPDWRLIGVSDDISPQHIYKALFAMAADAEFLVEDRLEEWVLSLATAALAMHALSWSDRYTVLGFQITDEMVFWGAFETLLFRNNVIDDECKHICSAMKRCQAEWDKRTFDVFTNARNLYREALIELGVSYQDVINIIKMGEGEHPQVYGG